MEKLKTDAILSRAETRIASGYACGLIGKEIADECHVSYNTVVKHTQNIYDKTGIRRSTNALVAWFIAKNFGIDLSEFKRRMGAFLLLCLLGFQAAEQGFNPDMVRRPATGRRVEARRCGRTRKGREDENTLTFA